jgi:hypothetical protein
MLPEKYCVFVNTPQAKAGGFRLWLKAGAIDRPPGRLLSLHNMKIIVRFRRLLLHDVFLPNLIGHILTALYRYPLAQRCRRP